MSKQLPMKASFRILLIAVFMLAADICVAQIEIRPDNAPIFLKHRNKKDALGRRQGLWLFFNSFGEKIQEVEYINGKREGITRRFYRGEKPMEETEYLEGRKDGDYRKYFISGNVQLEGVFANGKKDGKWTKYFDDGSTKYEGYYKTGNLEGVWKYYTRKGKVTSVTYVNGSKQSSVKDNAPAKNSKSAPGAPAKKSIEPATPQKQAENSGPKYIPTPNMPSVPKTN